MSRLVHNPLAGDADGLPVKPVEEATLARPIPRPFVPQMKRGPRSYDTSGIERVMGAAADKLHKVKQ